MPDKTITIHDIKKYLRQFAMDEVVGQTASAVDCPVARAGSEKYGERVLVSSTGIHFPDTQPRFHVNTMSPSIHRLVMGIDAVASEIPAPVTRADVEHVLTTLGKEALE